MASIDPRPSAASGDFARVFPEVSYTIAVASGKGGVGKSTVAVNLAACLAATRGVRVGLLDCDVYGPSLPVMMGISERPEINPATQVLKPLEKGGLKLMSMGFLSDAETPVIWPGRWCTRWSQP